MLAKKGIPIERSRDSGGQERMQGGREPDGVEHWRVEIVESVRKYGAEKAEIEGGRKDRRTKAKNTCKPQLTKQ